MNKKKYIAPTMEITELATVEMLAGSPNSSQDFGIFGEETEEDAKMANKRRGKWGNLWYQD